MSNIQLHMKTQEYKKSPVESDHLVQDPASHSG